METLKRSMVARSYREGKKSIGGTQRIFYDGEIIVWYNNGEYMFL